MRHRLGGSVIIGAVVAALFVASSGIPAVAAPIDDPRGDQKSDKGKPANAPKGDITRADGQKVGNDYVFRYTTVEPVDLRTDPNWDTADSNTLFLLDTNGDDKADFNIEYALDDSGLYANVYVDDGSPNPATLCDGKADFQGGTYSATIPASCIKNPPTVRYRVETSIDTNTVSEDNSVVAEDQAPDFGYAGT